MREMPLLLGPRIIHVRYGKIKILLNLKKKIMISDEFLIE